MNHMASICENKLRQVANIFGTPLYIYDETIIKKSYQELTSVFTTGNIFYSLKANPNLRICSVLAKCGAGAEVCSLIELEAAIKSGFKPENIIFVGPVKSKQTLQRCLQYKIDCIVCESLSELQRIADLAIKLNVIARVALRINPNFINRSALLKMGGVPSQFGIDEEIIFAEKKFILSRSNIKIIGIQIYNGTRILDAESIAENTQLILTFAKRLSDQWNLSFEMIDIGGGFGIPYYEDENELDLDELTKQLKPILKNYKKLFPKTRLVIESGRYLVGKSGVFVSQIQDIKTSKNTDFIITDGGINCHMAAVGLGALIKRNFPITLIKNNKTANGINKLYNITGPLCTPADQIAKQITLPEASINDLIAVHSSGAYGPTASPILFLSHGFPNEVLLKNNKAQLIREADTEIDLFYKQEIKPKIYALEG